MLNILAGRQLPRLEAFAAANVLIAFDYDGTLAPIAQAPHLAHMRPRTARLLARLAVLYPCVVISGRTLHDLSSHLADIPVWHLFGNHGAEPLRPHAEAMPRTSDWIASLKQRLPDDPGIVFEDKGYSLTIHYRSVSNKARTLELIAEALRQLPDARPLGGIEAINVLPQDGVHKGTALLEARRLFACDCAIYVGDDATDEDAFSCAPVDRLLAIRVGPSRSTAARYALRNQRGIDRLMEILIGVRARAAVEGAASS